MAARPRAGSGADDLAITLGVEEEFFLVDSSSLDLLARPDPAIFEACERNGGPHRIVPELLRSQIETNTRVCGSVAEVREALAETRRIVLEAAAGHGGTVMAASTHPFAAWEAQQTTPRERYERFAVTFQESVRRMLVSGMHVHAGFGDPDSRVRVMTALRRYLPLLLVLSTSSPFSGGRDTGFKSYRLNLLGALPRTSMPAPFASHADYEKMVADYCRMNFISDGTELWWDIRPSEHFPTVEMRICDVCTHLEDAMCIVALYASLVRYLLRRDREGALSSEPLTEIILENRWLAQRYGTLAFIGDPVEGGRLDIQDFAIALVDELAEDAAALGCEKECRRALEIIRLGSSADRQLDTFNLLRLDGAGAGEALRTVVARVVDETREGTGFPPREG